MVELKKDEVVYLLELLKHAEEDNKFMAELTVKIGHHGMRKIGSVRKLLEQEIKEVGDDTE